MTYKNLHAWNIACQLVESIYQLTASFPKQEQFGLTDQMRRAAVSIPSNIAEGHGRRSKQEFIRFCRISFGSLSELETQLILSKNLKLAKESSFNPSEQLLLRTQQILNRLISSLCN